MTSDEFNPVKALVEHMHAVDLAHRCGSCDAALVEIDPTYPQPLQTLLKGLSGGNVDETTLSAALLDVAAMIPPGPA